MAMLWDFENILNDSPAAILILNQPIHILPGTLLPLWERAGVRLLVDGGANRWFNFVKELNVQPKVPDYLTGDFDSVSCNLKKIIEESHVKIYSTLDQDESDYTKALRVVSSHPNLQDGIVLSVCENAGRLDQILANLETLHHSLNILSENNPVVLFAENQFTFMLVPNRIHKIKIPQSCVEECQPCGLIPLMGETVVSSSGLKWNLDKTTLQFGTLVSTSNTFISNEVQIENSKPLVFNFTFKE